MAGESRNITTIWTPSQGFLNKDNPTYPVPLADQGGYSVPSWYDSTDENGNPIATGAQQTGKATAGQWTGANGLVTQGVMNPYALADPQNPYSKGGIGPATGAPAGQQVAGSPTTPPQNKPGVDTTHAQIWDGDKIVGNPNYIDPNAPRLDVTSGAPLTNKPATSATPAAPPSPFQSGVNVSYPGGSSAANPLQWATDASAAANAKLLGGTVQKQDLTGPGYAYSSPQNQIAVQGGQMNAGLVQDIINKYGSAPGAYGAYLLARDKATLAGQSYVDPYAGKPGTVVNQTPANAKQNPVQFAGYGPGGYGSALPGTPGSPTYKAPAGGTAPPAGTAPAAGGTTKSTGPLPIDQWLKQQPPKPTTPITSPSGGSVRQASLNPGKTSVQSDSLRSPFNLSAFGLGADSTVSDAPAANNGTQIYGEYGYQPQGDLESSNFFNIGAGAVPSGESLDQPPGYPSNISSLINGAPGYDPNAPPEPVDSAARRASAYQDAGYYQNSAGGYSPAGTPDPSQQEAYQAYLASFGQGTETGTLGGNPIGGQTGQQTQPGTQQGGTPPTAPGAYTPGAPGQYGANGPYNAAVNPMYTQPSGEGLQYKSENDRALAMGRGESIDQDLINYLNQQQGRASGYEGAANTAYGNIAAGQGGYSPDQQANILREQQLQGIQTTDDQLNQNYLSEGEQAGIQGDPYAPYRQLGQDEQSIDQASQSRDAAVRGSLGAQDANVRGALANSVAGLRGATADEASNLRNTFGDVAANVRAAYGQGQGNIRDSLNYGEQNVRDAIDPNALNVSQDYLSNYNFSPQDEQDMVAKAGRGVGQNETANEDLLMRQANAQGNTSPLALEAARQRLQQTGGVNAADAMTDARIAARQLGLSTTQQREQTRLGAAQNLAGLQTGTELQLGSRRTAAEEALAAQQQGNEQYLGTTGLNTEGTIGAAERGTEQYLGAQQQQAEQYLGGARTGAEQTLGAANVASETGKTAMNLGAGQTADTAASQRAAQVAQNRQTTSQGNQATKYNQGLTAYGALSDKSKSIADQQLAQQQEYRNYLTGQGTQAQQNLSVGQQQRIGNAGTQFGAQNAATGNAIANYKVPSATEKAFGFLAKGGRVSGPTDAIVGEAGPELILSLPRYGGGGIVPDQYDPYSSGSGETPYEGSAITDDGGTMRPGDDPRKNPIYKQILMQMANRRYGMPGGMGTQDPNAGSYQRGGGGFLGKAANVAMMFGAAKGGVFGKQSGHHPYGRRGMPKAELVTHPEIRRLGTHGNTSAVIPLTKRPGNRLSVSDIPKLMEPYGGYGG